MTDIHTYVIDLPPSIYGAVTPCLNGYIVFINGKLNKDSQNEEYLYLLTNIKNYAFE